MTRPPLSSPTGPGSRSGGAAALSDRQIEDAARECYAVISDCDVEILCIAVAEETGADFGRVVQVLEEMK